MSDEEMFLEALEILDADFEGLSAAAKMQTVISYVQTGRVWLKTHYHYQEDWQYQYIEVNRDTMDIRRCQNIKENGVIVDTVDLIQPGEKGWLELFKSYGLPTIRMND